MSQPSAAALDPTRNPRRLVIYFAVLAVVYALGLWVNATAGFDLSVIVFMYAPLCGAIAARFAGPGVIQWGKPNWWLLAAFVPALVVLPTLLILSGIGLIGVDSPLLRASLAGAVGGILQACVGAFGEEVGWRGFLWPLFRRRMTFLRATVAIGTIWLLFHLPLVLLGDYGTLGGLPAFVVAILGFTLFIGVLTDRSRSVWPSVLGHGVWNSWIATSFDGAFTGSAALMGEFGWIPAIMMMLIGVSAAIWHQRTGGAGRQPA